MSHAAGCAVMSSYMLLNKLFTITYLNLSGKIICEYNCGVRECLSFLSGSHSDNNARPKSERIQLVWSLDPDLILCVLLLNRNE